MHCWWCLETIGSEPTTQHCFWAWEASPYKSRKKDFCCCGWCVSSQNKSQCRIKSHRAMLALGAPVQSSGHTGKSRFHSQNVVLQEPNLMVEIFYVLLPQRNSLEVLKNRSMEVPLYHKGKKKKVYFTLTLMFCQSWNSRSSLLHRCTHRRVLTQWIILGNYLVSCLKSLNCNNSKLSKSCNVDFYFFAKDILVEWAMPGLVL